MHFFLIFILSIISQSNAGEMMYMQFCLDSPSSAKDAIKKMQFIKAGADQIAQDDNCIDVTTSPNRTALYQKFMRVKYSVLNSSELSTTKVSENQVCHFEVTRIKKSRQHQQNVSASRRGIYSGANDLNSQSKSVSQISVSNGKPATLIVRDQSLNIICNPRSNGHDVEIEITSATNTLKTHRFIAKGAQIELGAITESLGSESNNLNTSPKLNKSITTGQNNELVYLKIK